MKYITTDYYHEFCCIAEACSDTCCAGWEITIDSKSIKNNQLIKGPLGNQLHNSIDWNNIRFYNMIINAFPQKLFEQINEARQVIFDILWDRTTGLKFRTALVLGLAHDLQKRIVSRDYESMERLIAHYRKKETQQSLRNKLNGGVCKFYNPYKCKGWKRLGRTLHMNGRRTFIKNVWKELLHLDALNKKWAEEIKRAQLVFNQLTVE